jgi:Ca2+-binding RTX toxin-like protein
MKRISTLLFTALLASTIWTIPANATGELASNGMACTIIGTEGDDELVGTSGDDILCGLGGDDEIDSGAGNDVVDGGSGDDFIELDSGDDYSFGGPGADKLFGGDGRDALLGGSDNDSLIGGTGIDDLDGEAGVNYCDPGTGDTTNNCFFDQGGPKLVSMSILNPKIDTSKSDQVLVIRARVDDVGTGVDYFSITFSPYNFDGGFLLFFQGGNFSSETCSGSGAVDPDPNNRYIKSSYCLISGDLFSGIYEIKVRVPRYTPKITWKGLGFNGFDFAGNQSENMARDLQAKAPLLTIKQTGKGDTFRPTLGAVTVMTKSINTQVGNAIVNVRFAYKDKGIGIKNFQGSFVLGNDFEKQINFFFEPFNFTDSCINDVAPDPDRPGGSTSCLIVGNELGGVVDFKIMMGKYSPKGTYKLHEMIIYDRGGNNTWYGGSKLAKNQKAIIKQVGKGDGSAPKISSIKVLTPKVSTGSGPAEVRIQVKASDDLAGISQLDIGLWAKVGKSSSSINFTFNATQQSCGPDGHVAPSTDPGFGTSVGCLVSGTLNNGVFEMIAVLPAHSAKRKYSLSQISTIDSARNGGGVSALQFPKLKAEVTNG